MRSVTDLETDFDVMPSAASADTLVAPTRVSDVPISNETVDDAPRALTKAFNVADVAPNADASDVSIVGAEAPTLKLRDVVAAA